MAADIGVVGSRLSWLHMVVDVLIGVVGFSRLFWLRLGGACGLTGVPGAG